MSEHGYGFDKAQRVYDNQIPVEVCEDECSECECDDCEDRIEDYQYEDED